MLKNQNVFKNKFTMGDLNSDEATRFGSQHSKTMGTLVVYVYIFFNSLPPYKYQDSKLIQCLAERKGKPVIAISKNNLITSEEVRPRDLPEF